MRIFIVRHADRETGNFYNEKLKHQDSPISEIGRQKAKRLLDYFRDKDIKRIIVSEYLRTGQTAQHIAQYKGFHVIKDGRLNEIDNGILESMADKEIMEKYPVFWADFFSYAKDVRFPEGETGEEVKSRQKDLLDELINKGEDTLLFSHDGFIRLLLCHLLGIPVYRRSLFQIDFCGIVEIEHDKQLNAWRIIRMNQTLDL